MDWISGYRLPGSLASDLVEGGGGGAGGGGSVSPPCSAPNNSSSSSLMNMWSNIKQEVGGNSHSPGLGGGHSGHTISTPGSIKGRTPGGGRGVVGVGGGGCRRYQSTLLM